jgi:two-component system cell cycle sensor histidine kinase/response regulator CckA
MWVLDLATRKFLDVNVAAVEHYGYSRDEFLSMMLPAILVPEMPPNLRSEGNQAIAERLGTHEARHLLKDGRIVDVETTSQSVMLSGHEAHLVTVRNITKEKHAEQILKERERIYRQLFEEAIICIFQSTPDGRLLDVNPTMARMFGFDSPAQMLASVTDISTQIYVDPKRKEEFDALMRKHSMVRHFEMQVYRMDGSKIWLWTNARAVYEGDTLSRYEGTFEDITDRKLIEDELHQVQQEYRDIVENAIAGISQSTPEGRYITANPALAKMLGYDSPQELLEMTTDISQQVYVDPLRREILNEAIRQKGFVTNFESQAFRKDGSKMWISANVRAVYQDDKVIRYEAVSDDVTERKQLEVQLLQAQKMEAVGQLAGGVAHDFNNALGVITGYSDLLQNILPADGTSHGYAVEIAKAGRRAAALTRQLLAFSRKQVIQPVVIDLNMATNELEKMLRRLIGENIEITFKRKAGLGLVKMDPSQVEQILMNLAVNSRDAMPDGGKLRIETANVELDESWARQNVYTAAGSYVMLSVTDSGCGIDKETQLHIFEPFFTTKRPGKGTGLGLSTVYGIVKQNAGYVIVNSKLEKGTTFKIYLPRLSDTASLPLPQPPRMPERLSHGAQTVLLVEDEDPLRSLTRTCLESNGYSVIDASDAAMAIHLAKKHNGQIHLLLTDIVMPGMSGRELAKRLIGVHPETRVLYMSGYANAVVGQDSVLDDHTALLEKPFTLQTLLIKVYQSLHEGES